MWIVPILMAVRLLVITLLHCNATGCHPLTTGTALHISSAEGNFQVVEALLNEGADKNKEDRWGQTPLQEAVACKQGPVVELLTQWGAKFSCKDMSSSMCHSASIGDVDQLKRLLENRADPRLGGTCKPLGTTC